MKPTIDVFEGETKNKGYLNKCKNHAKVYNCTGEEIMPGATLISGLQMQSNYDYIIQNSML